MLKDVVFQKGKILVTPQIFKTARRTYKISHIERIHIKRPWFVFSLPLAVGSYFLLNTYAAYLYHYEIYGCYFVMVGLPITLFNIGTLSVSSKALANDSAVTGFMPTLKQTRYALEEVLYREVKADSRIEKRLNN